jgi:predicted dehydrogenase
MEPSSDSPAITIGVVGTKWGLMHVGAFRAAGAEVRAICGSDRERTAEVARREGIELATVDAGELVACCDVVVVASPPDLHAAHVRAALAAGRHVLCEKPLTRLPEEADALADLAGRAPGVVAAVSFPIRFLEPLIALRRRIAEGALGRLRFASHTMAHGFGPEPDRGDPLGPSAEFRVASHAADATLWLTGARPEWVAAGFAGGQGGGISLLAGAAGGATLSVTVAAGGAPGIRGLWHAAGDAGEAAFEAGYVPALGGWEVGPVTIDGVEVTAREASDPTAPGSDPWYLAQVATARAMLGAVGSGARGGLARLGVGALVQRVLAAAARSALDGGARRRL